MKLLPILLFAGALCAQPDTGTLHGTLTDNSGAGIPSAAITLTPTAGVPRAATTRIDGSWNFPALPAGDYTLRVAYPGFALFEKSVAIATGKSLDLPIRLTVTAEKQEVTVNSDPGAALSVDAETTPAPSS
jgi:hypothetical protein